jgi:hypothetical protein
VSEDDEEVSDRKSEPPAAFLLALVGTDNVRKFFVEL